MSPARRILLGFASGEECRSALAAALGMAREMEAELVAILARDDTLTAVSGIPCVSVRSRTFPRWEEIDEKLMKRAFTAEAVRLETLIASGAKSQNIRWSFRTVSPEHVTEEWGEEDILLLPRSIPDGDQKSTTGRPESGKLNRYIMRLEHAGYRIVTRPAAKNKKETSGL